MKGAISLTARTTHGFLDNEEISLGFREYSTGGSGGVASSVGPFVFDSGIGGSGEGGSFVGVEYRDTSLGASR
jgi:hypothetical protein